MSYSKDLYNLIVQSKSSKVRDHIVVTNGVQSGDWLLQATSDRIQNEIDLRMEVVKTYPLGGENK